jgi:glycerophosphoryl diester phosphodiesterase
VRADDRLSVISFDEATIERVRELNPGIKTGYLLVPTQPIEPAMTWATERGHVGVHPWEGDLGLDPLPLMGKARAYGREIGCYVVNDPERMRHLAACGLWGFVTDVPRLARETLGPSA